eukprot:g4405.t1
MTKKMKDRKDWNLRRIVPRIYNSIRMILVSFLSIALLVILYRYTTIPNQSSRTFDANKPLFRHKDENQFEFISSPPLPREKKIDPSSSSRTESVYPSDFDNVIDDDNTIAPGCIKEFEENLFQLKSIKARLQNWLSAPHVMQEQAVLNGAENDASRFLVFRCDGTMGNEYNLYHACGGLGDRLKGIATLVLASLLTGRAFLIDSSYPVPLEEFFRVARMHGVKQWDWSFSKSAERMDLNYLVTSAREVNLMDHRISGKAPDTLICESLLHSTDRMLVVEINEDLRQEVVKCARKSVRLTKRLQKILQRLPLQIAESQKFDFSFFEKDIFFSLVLQSLFEPTNMMKEKLNEIMSRNGNQSHFDFCVHIRTGGDSVYWKDSIGTHQKITEEDINCLIEAIENKSEATMFLASDSEETIKQIKQKHKGNIISTEELSGKEYILSHLDKSRETNVDANLRTFLDWLILATRCKSIVEGFGLSGFLETASDFSQCSKVSVIMKKQKYLCASLMQNGKVIPNISWGRLEQAEKQRWLSYKCDEIVHEIVQEAVDYAKSGHDLGFQWIPVTVKEDDTISSIADKLGIGSKELMEWNNLAEATDFFIGKELMYRRLNLLPVPFWWTHYIVKHGDTVRSIAKYLKVIPDELLEWNKIFKTKDFFIGKLLKYKVYSRNVPQLKCGNKFVLKDVQSVNNDEWRKLYEKGEDEYDLHWSRKEENLYNIE